MFVIALTGGLGAGKTTASEYFRDRGATVIDLDEVAAHALGPSSAALEAVVERFGDVRGEDGALDREALAKAAFGSPEAIADLNALVHPLVAREVGEALREIRLLPNQPEVVVIEVPLLVEAPVFAEMADEVLAIASPLDLRVARAVARGLAEPDARQRIAAQATDEQRAALADEVIVNDGDEAAFVASLADYWERHVALGGSG